MDWKDRPSQREIDQKIKAAIRALSLNKRRFAPSLEKLVGEFMELDIGDASDVWDLIAELLTEIQIENYAGSHPPMRAYETNIANSELYAFVWNSKKLGKKMYLKFVIKESYFYYVSLHKSKIRVRGEKHEMSKV